jgi:hypothetical protein
VHRRGVSTDLEQYDEGLVAGQAPVDGAKYFRSVSSLTTKLRVLCSAAVSSDWHQFLSSVHVTSMLATSGSGSSQQVAAELEDEDPVGVRIPPVRDHSLRNKKPASVPSLHGWHRPMYALHTTAGWQSTNSALQKRQHAPSQAVQSPALPAVRTLLLTEPCVAQCQDHRSMEGNSWHPVPAAP